MAGGDKIKPVKKSILGKMVESKVSLLRDSRRNELVNEIKSAKSKSVLERNSVDDFIDNLIATKDLPIDQKIYIHPKPNEYSIDVSHYRRLTLPIVPIPKRPIIYSQFVVVDAVNTPRDSLRSSVDSATDHQGDEAEDSYQEEPESDQSTAYNKDYDDFDYMNNIYINDINLVKYCIQLKNRIKELTTKYKKPQLTSKQLDEIELLCFYEWRKVISTIEEVERLPITPYEKNIEYWRQLWRVVERSHLICIVIDARNPLFYRVPDLEYYIEQVDRRKQTILILNKSDLLTREERSIWADYFKKINVKIVFFSALRELYAKSSISLQNNQAEILEENSSAPAYGDLSYDTDTGLNTVISVSQLLDHFVEVRDQLKQTYQLTEFTVGSGVPQFVVGFIGYPNVGKSSIINAIMSGTRVSVSAQPGKTKHFQTLQTHIPGITLCDCPGLVFPSLVATKYHLLTNGVSSFHQFKGPLLPAVQIICDYIPEQICKKFSVDYSNLVTKYCMFCNPGKGNDSSFCRINARLFLEKLCEMRKFNASGRGGQLDLNRASRLVLSNYMSGHLLYVHLPPDYNHAVKCPLYDQPKQEKSPQVKTHENFEDIKEWMDMENPTEEQPLNMTKRKMRFLRKKMLKSNN